VALLAAIGLVVDDRWTLPPHLDTCSTTSYRPEFQSVDEKETTDRCEMNGNSHRSAFTTPAVHV
jgi:hypothetical protein